MGANGPRGKGGGDAASERRRLRRGHALLATCSGSVISGEVIARSPSSGRLALESWPPANSPCPRPRGRPRAIGWLTAGGLRIPCALGPAGIVRRKREGDGGTPAGRFKLLWALLPPGPAAARRRRRAAASRCGAMPAGARTRASRNYNRPVRAAVARRHATAMWRDDALYDLTFVLDQNFSKRREGRGQRDLLSYRAAGLTPTAGCVAIRAADMRRLAPRLSARTWMAIG